MASPFTPATIPSSSGTGDGWTAIPQTLAYTSADSPTFTMTCTGTDLTGTISVGMKMKLTQTTAKYFIVTAIAFSTDTTITVYGGTDYTLANAAITSPYYSPVSVPQGFPADPTKWTVTVISDTGDRTQASPTSGTWYNLGTLSGSIPIGLWEISASVITDSANNASGNQTGMSMALSTSNNSVSDSLLQFVQVTGQPTNSASNRTLMSSVIDRQRIPLSLAAKTTYYLIGKANAANYSNIDFRGDLVTTKVLARCSYL